MTVLSGGKNDERTLFDGVPLVKVAAYFRMSTEHQKYSLENQSDVITEYAKTKNYEVVKVYSDGGKSGVTIKHRSALQQLLEDVKKPDNSFKVVLVLDVTRWGRFQDTDASAYYEYSCKLAGVKVEYCAEPFDDTPFGSMMKGMKRVMAAEYSRELSGKVFRGQAKLISLGFRQGGFPGYGLRRMLVDERRVERGILASGEHKSIQTDRIILVPGPREEIEIVLEIYRNFIFENKNEQEIANDLNRRSIKSDLGNLWTRGSIHQILTNEKYIGNNVFGRYSSKLGGPTIKNPESEWIRKDSAFEGIVPKELFFKAQGIILARSRSLSNDDLLKKLDELYKKRGYLSAIVIDEAEGMPSSSVYQSRFGGLLRAYELIGFTPDRDYRYIEINRFLREIHADAVEEVLREIEAVGGKISPSKENDILTVNDEFTVSIVVCRAMQLSAGKRRWKVRFDTSLHPDVTVAVRMDTENKDILDYYLLPALDFNTPQIRLIEQNASLIDSYRFDDLSFLFGMAERMKISEIA